MGNFAGSFGVPSSSSPSTNPKTTATTNIITMSSSQSEKPQNPQSDPAADHPKTLDPQTQDQESTDPSPTLEQTENQEEEEEGECGFCVFMKGGGCKEVFTNWEKCIEQGEKNNEDIVDKCFEVTSALKKCMEANQDYYSPILKAEKAAEQEAIKQLDKEKEAAAAAATSESAEEQQKPASS